MIVQLQCTEAFALKCFIIDRKLKHVVKTSNEIGLQLQIGLACSVVFMLKLFLCEMLNYF